MVARAPRIISPHDGEGGTTGPDLTAFARQDTEALLASLVAVLIGGVLLGIVGVLVAIPVAAAIRLLLQEVAFPRLDKS